MFQEWLSNYAIINIQHDIKIVIKDIMTEFARRKSRKVDFTYKMQENCVLNLIF